MRFAGTPPMVTALANNELEIGDLAFSTLPIAIQNAGIDDLRVIADEFQDGVAGYYSHEFMVLNDGPIKKVEDLKGKVVATNAVGSAVDVAMRAMLRKHGLEDKRDYTIVEAPFPGHARDAGGEEGRLDPGRAAVLARSGAAQDRAAAVLQHDAIGVTAVRRVDGAQAVHRQEPRRAGRLSGGHAAHRALVSRSEEPRRGGADRRHA